MSDKEALKIEYVPIKSISGYFRNAKTHPPAQVKALAASIKQFGFNQPILIDTDNVIVAGHGRLEAAKSLKLEKVPTIKLGHLTDAQRRAYILADNKISEMGGWDQSLLDIEMADLKLIGADLDLSVVGSKLSFDTATAAATDWTAPNKVEPTDVKGLYNGAIFEPDGGELDYPKLRSDMLLELPDRIDTWAGWDIPAKPPYLWTVSAPTRDLDWKQTVICFYADDERFEGWWTNPAYHCEEYQKKGILGAVIPNFSTYSYPKAVRLHQMYKSRYVARYMQEAGIKIVPDLDCQLPEVEAWCHGLKGLSDHMVTQCHQKMDGPEIVRQNNLYNAVFDILKPKKILVIITEDRLELFPCFKRVKVVRCEPRALLRGKAHRMKQQQEKV